MAQANETEDMMEKAADTTKELVESVEDGKVTKDAEKEMAKFKELAEEKLNSMRSRAQKMMVQYRDLAEKAEGSIQHAERLQANLTRARSSMSVARETLHASMLQSQEAWDILSSELDGIP